MSNASPPSVGLPPKESSSAPFAVVAVVLVAIMGGLVCWKLKQDAPTPTAAVVSSTPASTTRALPRIDAPPPPPPLEEVEATASKKVTKPVPGGPLVACGADCSGSPGAARAEVQAKAAAARGCYERALRVNPNLQGSMRVNITVDAQGVICSATIANDSMGAADVASCVLSLFRGQRVTAPTGGCVNMSIPLNFAPKGKL